MPGGEREEVWSSVEEASPGRSASANRPARVSIRDLVVIFAVDTLALVVVAWLLPGFTIDGWWEAVVAAVALGVLNGVVWPVVVRFASTLVVWTLGIAGLVANGAVLLLAASIVPGVRVDGLGTAVLATLGMAVVGAVTGNLLAVDDDAVWQRNMVNRMVRRLDPPQPTDVPGVLFLQIDGLSESVLRRALGEGYMPTLARWVRSGSHRIVGWECDLSSQTGASQAGILHGNNVDMPAFRWYDKDLGRVLTSNRPHDAALIEQRQSDGNGLLVDGGVSRSNVFSGDSDDSLFTFSTVAGRSRPGGRGLTYFLSDSNSIPRLIVLSLADVGREIAASWRARRRRIEPRLRRGGVYPLLRAATTVVLRDLTVYTLLSDVYRGVPAAYADFVGYDEVAHHSGIAAPDALETLWRLDQQLARIERAIAEAPRPYHVVVLSDHGQTQGATFLQRYGTSLADLVGSLLEHGGPERGGDVAHPEFAAEGWGNLNGLLTDAVQNDDSRLARLIAAGVRRRTVDGEVVLGPGFDAVAATPDRSDAVVLASGNLGLISFPRIPGRASLEELASRYPGLVKNLAEHPGIGFVLVHSESIGALAIGGDGVHHLATGEVDGVDPLVPFGPNTADHLRRTDSFHNAPDILVNSFYDPNIDEGAAFEELIGFHGGLGGKQAEPFLLVPTSFPLTDEPIVGAATVHHIFKGWRHHVTAGDDPHP